MSYHKFSLAIKSTLDYHAKLLADSKGLPFVDLAGTQFENDVFESDQPAICWEFSTIKEDPVDPMWLITFDMGAMTMMDPSQYVSLDIISMLSNAFRNNARFDIYDYSGLVTPTVKLGVMTIIDSGVLPQQQDRATGFRFVSVMARATRL